MLVGVRRCGVPVPPPTTGIWSFCEVTDAAAATVAAVTRGAPGVYNIADDEPPPVAQWLPFLAQCLGVKPPMPVPAWLGKLPAGDLMGMLMTHARGTSYPKAKAEISCTHTYAPYRDGVH